MQVRKRIYPTSQWKMEPS